MKRELKNNNSSRKSGGKRHQWNGSSRGRVSRLEKNRNHSTKEYEKKLKSYAGNHAKSP